MSLKQIIKQSKILNPVINAPMELPGEPMIYSLKYPVGQRTRGLQFYRNMQWKSLLKTFFRSFYRTSIPVVVIVRFFVSPPASVTVSDKLLRQESLPAVMSYELCDYTLSFLEMLHHVLFNSYRQVVKLDVEKIYSKNPRTVVKFMKWDEYVKFQAKDTDYTQTQGLSAHDSGEGLQPQRKRNERGCKARKEEPEGSTDSAAKRPASGSAAFRPAGTTVAVTSKKKKPAMQTT